MSITVDDQPVEARQLGVRTVGELLARIADDNRLVVSLMVDGIRPQADALEKLRSQPLEGRVVYIETTEPHQIAGEVIDEARKLLAEAETLRTQAVEHLQNDRPAEAFKRLAVCFRTWGWTRESVEKLSQLLRIDLEQIQLDQQTLAGWLIAFTQQLEEIRQSLEARDYTRLSDVLAYEADATNARWQEALDAIQSTLEPPH